MTTERWRPVLGRETHYSVSDKGRVRSESRTVVVPGRGTWNYKQRMMRLSNHPSGRLTVWLYKDGIKKFHYVHRLVLETFIGPPPEGMECLHWDGDPLNNHLDNLRWGTRSENLYDAVRTGTPPALRKNVDLRRNNATGH